MLKLPKGLKKKKKGKKSKKNQELFTEEELEQYKREHREKSAEEESHASTTTVSDDEWSKFNALTTGIDTVLKKTQGDLDRIKESSFFQRVTVPPKSKQLPIKNTEPSDDTKQLKPIVTELPVQDGEVKQRDKLTEGVVELSESEEESEDVDDIFDTTYIDIIASGDVPLAYIPESPTETVDDGPDPFDTTYADKVIKGPEVSQRGKKIVNIGSAVHVLTGRVDKVSTAATPRRPRRGPQNLLLDTFDEPSGEAQSINLLDEPITTLLDEPSDNLPDIPIDLTVSLHIALQEKKQAERKEDNSDLITEFDSLTFSGSDKKIEAGLDLVNELTNSKIELKENPTNNVEIESEDFDPFDTVYVEKVLENDDDSDFDPRAGETDELIVEPSPSPNDLLCEHNSEDVPVTTLTPLNNINQIDDIDFDPFDTTAIVALVKPNESEIRRLEQELLTESLIDPDFDPRAEESIPVPIISTAQRKSSLSLNINRIGPKSVGFDDRLPGESLAASGIKKQLTPYNREENIFLGFEENDNVVDPFDTSFVLVQDTEEADNLSDDSFDPRRDSPIDHRKFSIDLLEENLNPHDIKVLTPANLQTLNSLEEVVTVDDPFDTTAIGSSILPGRAELKIIENELLPTTEYSIEATILLETNTDSQELGLGDKVLTPQVNSIEFTVDDPFDTSIANNLAPCRAEVKLLESEFIG